MNDNAGASAPEQKTAPKTNTAKRRRLFAILVLAILGCAIAWCAYWFLYASKFVSTDNAYTATEVAQVTPEISGTVAQVNVVDTQTVKKGDVLVIIDEVDARLALNQAKADESMAQAQLSAAIADQKKAAIDLQRRKALVSSGSVSADEVTAAENALASAMARIDGAKAAIAQAKARAEQASVDLGRTVLKAPVDGVVSKRTVQVGQKVQPGVPILAVVPIQDVHVDANFKEGQLKNVRPGQKATVVSDIHGSSVEYHGVVDGFSGGTGSAFALIPAQNATGNWIKVVQRLPVRIKLDPEELKAHPLQVGLSMEVTIDTASDEKQQ
ncbi:MAG: efflux RND transporter periplasmic adaptor subunit [Oxalobacter sp.]